MLAPLAIEQVLCAWHPVQLSDLHTVHLCLVRQRTISTVVCCCKQVELVPGGIDRAVTAANRIEYIHRVANYRLNVQIRAAAEAFRAGLELVVSRNWTTMFNEGELQMLISGGEGEGLNLSDLQAHVHYAGGYHEEHPVIHDLWDVSAWLSRRHLHGQASLLTTTLGRLHAHPSEVALVAQHQRMFAFMAALCLQEWNPAAHTGPCRKAFGYILSVQHVCLCARMHVCRPWQASPPSSRRCGCAS